MTLVVPFENGPSSVGPVRLRFSLVGGSETSITASAGIVPVESSADVFRFLLASFLSGLVFVSLAVVVTCVSAAFRSAAALIRAERLRAIAMITEDNPGPTLVCRILPAVIKGRCRARILYALCRVQDDSAEDYMPCNC